MSEIRKAAKAIKEAKYLLITAGAGMGVDSGLPDFRGDEGFWKAYPIAKKLGLNFQALANPRWFDLILILVLPGRFTATDLICTETPRPMRDLIFC